MVNLITQRSVVQIHPPQPRNASFSAASMNPATIRIDKNEALSRPYLHMTIARRECGNRQCDLFLDSRS